MTKPTYDEYKREQSESDRREVLAELYKFEKASAEFIITRKKKITQLEEEITSIQKELVEAKKAETEITENQKLFVKMLETVAAQPFITRKDIEAVNSEYRKVGKTEAERELIKKRNAEYNERNYR